MKNIQMMKGIGVLLCLVLLTGCGNTPPQEVIGGSVAESQVPDIDDVEKSTEQSGEAMEEIPPESTEPETEEKEDEIITFTISATGDVSLGILQTHDYKGTFNEMWDLKGAEYFFGNVKDIFAADDMTLINFEGVLTTSDQRVEKKFNIKGKPEYVQILTQGDVEAAAMGNNHRMDYGEEGLADTVKALEEAGIVYGYDDILGYYEDTEKGIKVGFVSVNEVYDEKQVEKYLEEGIAALKADETVDLVIACCHWGDELDNYPNEYELNLGKKCIDWGADLVIGHHPHVMQGIEEYNGRFIVYSLGNFCFGGNKNPKDKDTMIFQQTFTFVNGVKQEDKTIRVIPCRISSVTSKNDYCPTPVIEKAAVKVIDKINEFSKQFELQFDYNGYPVTDEPETEAESSTAEEGNATEQEETGTELTTQEETKE